MGRTFSHLGVCLKESPAGDRLCGWVFTETGPSTLGCSIEAILIGALEPWRPRVQEARPFSWLAVEEVYLSYHTKDI